MAAGAGRLREQSRRLFAGYATMAIAVVATFTAIASGGTGKGACRRGHQARGSPHGGPAQRPAPEAGTSERPAIRNPASAGLPGLPDGDGPQQGWLSRCWRCAPPGRSSCCLSRPGRRPPAWPSAVWCPATSCPGARQPRGPRPAFRPERAARMPPRPGRRHRRRRLPRCRHRPHRLRRHRSRPSGPRPRHGRRAGTRSSRRDGARLACGEACGGRAPAGCLVPGRNPGVRRQPRARGPSKIRSRAHGSGGGGSAIRLAARPTCRCRPCPRLVRANASFLVGRVP